MYLNILYLDWSKICTFTSAQESCYSDIFGLQQCQLLIGNLVKEGFWPDSGLPISISLSNQINNLIWIQYRTRYWNSMEKRCRKLEDRVLSCQSLQEFTGRVYATGNPQACFELGTGQTEISLRIPIGTQCGSVQSVSFKIQGEYFANKSGSDNRCSWHNWP